MIAGNATFVDVFVQTPIQPTSTRTILRSAYRAVAARVVPRTECLKCGATFSSRRQLFKHLRSEQHGVLTRNGSPVLAACAAGHSAYALLLWERLTENTQRAVARECDDAGRTVLHNAVTIATGAGTQQIERNASLVLIAELIRYGADAHRMSRPDTIWQDAPELSSFEAATPVQLARRGQTFVLPTVRAVLGRRPEQVVEHCAVCLDEHVLCCDELRELNLCKHRCCPDALRRWLLVQVSEGATFDTLKCPVGACAVAEADLLAALGGNDLAQLQQQSLELTLSMMPDFVWCPRCPSGGLVPEGASCSDAQCARCKFHFCVRCKRGWAAHEGMSCNQFVASGGLAASTWLEKHTRACPKCSVAIELVSGCSHMTCRLCKHNFCWLCLGDYKSGNYNMNPAQVMRNAERAKGGDGVRCPCGNEVILQKMRR